VTPDASGPPQRSIEPQEAADDRPAIGLSGFGPTGIFWMLVILLAGNIALGPMVTLPAGGLLVLAWARLTRTPWAALGYVPPESWIVTLTGGIAFGAVFKLLMKMLAMPLIGAPPVNSAYHFLAGNRALLPAAVWTMLAAGFGEETVFRGYLFERAARLFGRRAGARAAAVLLTSALFAAAHYAGQGLPGVEQAAITGLVFGAVFAATGRLFFLMFAHAAFDLTALAMIYLDVESRVAHLLFR
jgi:membrane protease YdiL (CAAX protease family)